MTDEERPDLEGHVPAEEESSLLNRRTLLIAAGGLLAMIVFVHLVGGVIYGFFVSTRPVVEAPTGLPPEPRLQVAPVQDLQILQATERALISNYEVLDQEGGIVRIPVERAMELIAERRLPVFESEVEVEPRVQADESGFPNATLDPPATPAFTGTPLLEITVTRTITATATQQAPVETGPAGTPSPESTGTPGALSIPSGPQPVRAVWFEHNGGSSPPDPVDEVGFDQQLNAQLPLELAFLDEKGDTVRLGDYFGRKPVILLFAYYECPMLCTVVLNDLTESLRELTFDIGDQFEVVTVSMDHRETPIQASTKKAVYLQAYGRPGAEQGWHFLTGDEASIHQLAQTVGFRFAYDEKLDQYAHPTGVMIVTPEGRISHYFLGIEYPANDLRLGLVEAARGEIGTPVDQFFLLCYAYDPVTGRYTLLIKDALRLAGLGTLLVLGVVVVRLLASDRRKKSQEAPAKAGQPDAKQEAQES